MNLLFKLSFIISGLFIRDLIYYDTLQLNEIFLFTFIAVIIYQYLYVFILYKREGDEISHRECLANWVLYYTITIEVTIAVTAVVNVSFRGGYADMFATPSPEPYKILIIIFPCIAYQVLFCVIKTIRKPK